MERLMKKSWRMSEEMEYNKQSAEEAMKKLDDFRKNMEKAAR